MKSNIGNKFDLKMLFQVAFDTKRKAGGFLLGIIVDIIASSYKYDMSYKEYRIYEFYKLTSDDRKKFLMMSDASRLDERYNSGVDRAVFKDKLKFSERFAKDTKVPVLDLRVAGQQRFKNFVEGQEKVVAKQLQADQGVRTIDITENSDLVTLRKELIADSYFLLEYYIYQHKALEKLYPESVNTLRVLTFVDENNDVIVLNTALKLGNRSQRDNFSRGGLFSVPDEHGEIIRPFVNKFGNIYETHPISGELLMGFQIPFYHEAIELCQRVALEVSGVRYVGWDVALTESGPILVDGSVFSKMFQIPPSVSAFVGEEIQDLRSVYSAHMDLSR